MFWEQRNGTVPRRETNHLNLQRLCSVEEQTFESAPSEFVFLKLGGTFNGRRSNRKFGICVDFISATETMRNFHWYVLYVLGNTHTLNVYVILGKMPRGDHTSKNVNF